MKYEVAGDPVSGLRWTRKTTKKIAAELSALGIRVSRKTVAKLLKQMNFSLRTNKKKISNGSPPTRDAQFANITQLRERFSRRGNPILSVDTKKKELVGRFKNPGRVWAQKSDAVNDHDFRSMADGVAIPYGIYDLQSNRGTVYVGTSYDTSQFAVECIEKWWRSEGQKRFPGRKHLLVVADTGGSNGATRRAWKHGIQHKLCNEHGLDVTVAHYPPGASKWNPIEHRLFSEISKNWAGRPLDSYETILNFRECAILSWKLKRLPTPWFDDVGKNNIKPQEKGAEMGSLLRTAKKHKKSRRLGEPEVMAREEYGELEVDVKIEMIRSLIPLGLMHVHELLDDEVKELAGERYARKDELERGRRHGTNPGTVGLAGQRVPIRVPRVRSQEGVEIPLRSYEALNDGGEVNDLLLKRVLYGISCRNYEAAAEAIPGAIGLSSSTVSRGFVQASAAKLREMQERDLSGEDVVALFLDGKSFADAMMVIALGITLSGKKRFLGFVETDTENEKVLTPFLRSLLARGLDSSQGLLVIIDGGKSLKAAVKKAFRKRVLIQRCQWHKRENVVSYLSKGEQASLRKRLQSAYNRPEYKEALAALDQLHDELEERNQSAAASLEEGIEETLTLHRLGVYGVLGRSFKTTNCLESVNALVEERCAKVDHWKNSSQRQRWLATALVDIEPRLRRVIGYRHLPKLREALKRELKIETKTSTVSKKKAA